MDKQHHSPINQIRLKGKVSAPPQIYYFSYDNCRLDLKLETREQGLRPDGEDWVQWHNIRFHNDVAQALEEELKVGDELSVLGRIAYHKEDDGKGGSILKTFIYAQSYEIHAINQVENKEIKTAGSKPLFAPEELNWESYQVEEDEDPMA